MRNRKLVAALAATVTLGAGGVAVAQSYPDRLDLPDGWQPEGIASGRANELFVGSLATGDIFRFDARSGRGRVAIDAPDGSVAVGLEVGENRRLFVAGGPTGRGFVYNLRNGRRIASIRFARGQNTFVNDVVVTDDAAYFTESRRSVLYVVDTDRLRGFRRLRLPDIPAEADFNLNGIAASPDGDRLLAISAGTLWNIDAETGRAEEVDVTGGELTNGDGLLLVGRMLYVVRNQDNAIAAVRLSRDWSSGRVRKTIESDDFSVPTTVANVGNRLYAANARFGMENPEELEYWVTQVRR